tara:strand:- start:18356 stop:19141 length:786 start_codon:yes stop_codon:yes gene_type:complete
MSKLIAEIGWNHMGDMDLAKSMVFAAAQSGADYAKFQTWSVDNLKSGPWDDDGRRQIYEKAQINRDQHHQLADFCRDANIGFLTSCFNKADLPMIRELGDMVKIASTECTNEELVLEAINMFNTVLISTGATKFEEASRWAEYGNVVLLHCVSSYPCPADQVNLQRIEGLRSLTPRVGYSGHYDGYFDAIAAATMGCEYIEKHFTTDKTLPGRDNKFALLPEDLEIIANYMREVNLMQVDRGRDYQQCEQEARDVYAGRWS